MDNLISAVSDIRRLGVGEGSFWFQSYLDRSIETVGQQAKVCAKLKSMHPRVPTSFADIGSAPFVLPYLLRKHKIFKDVVAFDIDPFRFENVSKFSFPIHELDIEKKLEISRTFDIIYFSHIFEHLRKDLVLTMDNLKSLMDENSLLYIETPNGLGLKTFRNMIQKGATTGCASDLYEEWSKIQLLQHMGHVREYGKGELITFFDKVGLKVETAGYVEKISPTNFTKMMAYALQSSLPFLKNNLYFILSKK